MLNQNLNLNSSFFTDVSGKLLPIILLPILLTGCVATGQPLSQVGKVVEISEEPPDASFLEIGPISASSGAGCGAYGPRGNLEATVNNLKNKAGEMGASYVLIQKTFESTSLLGCRL